MTLRVWYCILLTFILGFAGGYLAGFGPYDKPISTANAATQSPNPITAIDTFAIDTFANYSYRNSSSCNISSLDLHTPFFPLCNTRPNLLTALSSGGRHGFEAPYTPLSCSMRWYNTAETCSILSRFSAILIIGDSMMRHLTGALNVLLRSDLGYGAVTNWNFSPEEFRSCFCNHQFDVKSCSLQGIFRTSDVLKHDPTSLACDEPVNVIIEMMLKYPLLPDEVERYTSLLSPTKPKKPYAFILGHGLWNDLDVSATLHWLDGLTAATTLRAPTSSPLHPKPSPDCSSPLSRRPNETRPIHRQPG